MEEMKWISSAMLGVLAANKPGFAWLKLESAIPFWPAEVPRRHGMSKISQTEPSQHETVLRHSRSSTISSKMMLVIAYRGWRPVTAQCYKRSRVVGCISETVKNTSDQF
jgi:hypothetical protein